MKKVVLILSIGIFAVSCGTKESSMSTSATDSTATDTSATMDNTNASTMSTDTMTTKTSNADSLKMRTDSSATTTAPAR
ncbi:cytochrome C551 [Chryseobacterium camelliae]|uniref:cytochrome C551 n=1 Tax=Chryseobacterium camelliae TaxID=1265445 RepID=UPI000C1C8B1F|nr:cytochrome C551 [Chryseobacterium camelliae]MDR6515811.1 hypothetical protein [Chryseobacterium camelliae]